MADGAGTAYRLHEDRLFMAERFCMIVLMSAVCVTQAVSSGLRGTPGRARALRIAQQVDIHYGRFRYVQHWNAMSQTAKISSKGQVTVPIAIRKALNANPGDCLIWDVSDSGSVVVRHAREVDVSYLSAVSGTLSEWNSDEDEETFADL